MRDLCRRIRNCRACRLGWAFWCVGLPIMVIGGLQAHAQTSADATSGGAVEQVTVTSERREENIQTVPVAVQAFTPEVMDENGIEVASDLVRMTPGLVISNPETLSGNSISIRGIASAAGAATTGVYIDDTPIQAGVLGTGSTGQVYPNVFDLERVEVLKGPQGTLFGSGSEGGTVRFITPQPSLTDWTTYARAEVNSVGEDAAVGYEYGLAVGGPIVDNELGFRISGYYKKSAGWVNEEQGTVNVLNATGAAGPGSIQFQPSGLTLPDANWQTDTAINAAVTWKPFSSLEITPSVRFEDHYIYYQQATFYVQASDPTSDTYVSLLQVPVVNATHVALPDPLNEPADDQYVLPALRAKLDLSDAWSLVSNTSLMVRKEYGWEDYPSYETTYARSCCVNPGDKADADRSAGYDNVVEEMRVAFNDPDSRFSGTAGVFYSSDREVANQYSLSNYFFAVPATGTTTVIGPNTYPGGVTNGPPFGPGYSAWINYFGQQLPTFNAATSPTSVPGAAAGSYPDIISYYSHLVTHQEQEALYAQVDYKVLDNLTATLGLRGSLISSDIYAVYGGATSNLNAPHGLPCVPGTGGPGQTACSPVAVGAYAPGTGPFAIAYPGGGASTFERAFTPRFDVKYNIDDENMIYASASKGFRPGGSQPELNSGCDFQLIQLGYSEPNPNGSGVIAKSPTSYGSDSVWDYEVGTKDTLLDGRLQLDSSAYLITWRNIQTSVSVSSCLQSIVGNLGGASSKGFDLQAEYIPIDNLTIGLSGGFNSTTFTGNVILGGNEIYAANSAIPNSGPAYQVNLSGRYDFKLGSDAYYVLGDFTFFGKTPRSGSTIMSDYNFDPNLVVNPAYSQTNIRIGRKFDAFDLSAFINNLTDESPRLGYTHTSATNPVYTAYTIQPRTIGIEGIFQY